MRYKWVSTMKELVLCACYKKTNKKVILTSNKVPTGVSREGAKDWLTYKNYKKTKQKSYEIRNFVNCYLKKGLKIIMYT